MSLDFNLNEPFTVKHWDTYKVLNKIKETIHHKRKHVRENLNEEKKSSIENRIKCTNRELSELLRDGEELITNVKIANDRREIHSRNIVSKERRKLVNDLRDESTLAASKLTNITAMWSELDSRKDPISFHNGLETLKSYISDLMNQKDDVIHQLHETLGKADERYASSQECKSDDIQCLIERVNQQVEVMKNAYREHLELLHESIDDEQVSFKQRHTNKWLELHDLREETELQNLADIQDKNEFYDTVTLNVQRDYEEKCRNTRIQLDRDNDKLQIELLNMNAETILNTEKLNYNHHVLQKRTEENIIVRHQQKQRLVRMGSTIAEIRSGIESINHVNSEEIRKNSQDVAKLYENVRNLTVKCDSLACSNDQKNVWDMYESNGFKQIQEIIAIDRILHEQALEIDWEEPESTILRKTDLKSIKDATVRVRSAPKNQSMRSDEGHIPNVVHTYGKLADEAVGSIALKHIIEEICKQTGWLVDENLETLLKPYPEVSKTNFVQIDNIFEALGIQSVAGLENLKEYFLRSARCKECSLGSKKYMKHQQSQESLSSDDSVDHESSLIPVQEKTSHCSVSDHRMIIDFDMVLPTLERFLIEQNNRNINAENTECTEELNINNVENTLSRLMDSKDVDLFWKSFNANISKRKALLWTSLETGLNRYFLILKKRQKLDAQCEFLRRQNEELKHMLLQYLPE